MLFLVSANAAVDPAEIVNQLFPNLWIFLAHLLATIVLLMLLTKWVYNPFRKAMRARREFIRNIITDARQKQIVANQNSSDANQRLTTAKNEAITIVAAAKNEAEEKKLIILDAARDEIHELNDHAKLNLERERQAMKEDIRKSIIEISFQAAQAVVKSNMDQTKHEEIIDDFIKEI